MTIAACRVVANRGIAASLRQPPPPSLPRRPPPSLFLFLFSQTGNGTVLQPQLRSPLSCRFQIELLFWLPFALASRSPPCSLLREKLSAAFETARDHYSQSVSAPFSLPLSFIHFTLFVCHGSITVSNSKTTYQTANISREPRPAIR